MNKKCHLKGAYCVASFYWWAFQHPYCGRNPVPPKKPWSADSSVNTNGSHFPWFQDGAGFLPCTVAPTTMPQNAWTCLSAIGHVTSCFRVGTGLGALSVDMNTLLSLFLFCCLVGGNVQAHLLLCVSLFCCLSCSFFLGGGEILDNMRTTEAVQWSMCG